MSKFKVGDKVKYVNGMWSDGKTNPIWDGKHGKVVGTVSEVDFDSGNLPYNVKGENGSGNVYNERDLEFTKPPPFKRQDLTPEEQLTLRLEQVEYENAKLTDEVRYQRSWIRDLQYQYDEMRRYIDRFEDERRERRCLVPKISYSDHS